MAWEHAGFEVIEADMAPSASKTLRPVASILILCDVRMEKNGRYRTLAALRQDTVTAHTCHTDDGPGG